MFKKILLITLLFSQIAFAEKSDHKIFDKFDNWKVRHVFDEQSLKYRQSDVKTSINRVGGGTLDFQFNRRSYDGRVQYIINGWLRKVTIKVDEKEFVSEQKILHTFYADAPDELLEAISKTNKPIEVTIIAGRWEKDAYEIKGTIPPPKKRLMCGINIK